MKIYKQKVLYLFIFLTICSPLITSGQAVKTASKDSIGIEQKDVVDIFQQLFNKEMRKDSTLMKDNGPFFSLIPVIGYSLHTGLTAVLATSTTFYSDAERKKNSLCRSGFPSPEPDGELPVIFFHPSIL